MAVKLKGGFRATLPIKIVNFDINDADSIEFMFKQKQKDTADVLKTALWVNGAETEDVYTVTGEDNVIYVRFTQEDTYNFKRGAPFYVDTRINVHGAYDNPLTPIVSTDMNLTLFGEGEAAE